jgi:peptide/nickel transport system permease protein
VAQYLIRRLLLSVLVLFLTTIATFALAHSVPGDPVNAIVSEKIATPEVIAQVRHKYGFDKPVPVQYVLYLKNLLHGDLGQSLTTRHSVGRDLKEFFPATIELALFAMFFAIVVGGPLGMIAAIRHNGIVDHTARGVSLFGTAVPIYYLALLAQTIFAYRLKLLPFGGRLDDGVDPPKHFSGLYTLDALVHGQWGMFGMAFKHVLLPSLVLGSFAMGIIARMVRSSLLDVMNLDYVRTARAKGLPERTVIGSHALRNALIPTVTILGLTFGGLLAGAVFTESIFRWPGLGQYAVQTATKLDFAGVLGVTLVVAVVIVTLNLLVDILYGVLDPRIRLG